MSNLCEGKTHSNDKILSKNTDINEPSLKKQNIDPKIKFQLKLFLENLINLVIRYQLSVETKRPYF